MKSRGRIFASGIVAIGLAGGAFTFGDHILWSMGAFLTSREAPQKADIIVVIGGDFRGSRILTAAELVHKGYAPKVLVSGAGAVYGFHESDLAIEFAVKHGYPRDSFIGFHYPALSTVEEARADIAQLRLLGVHKYLLVTSDYHTRRAGRIFRREAQDLEEHTIGAPDRYWADGRWWTNREGRKIWFDETVKTFADYLRI